MCGILAIPHSNAGCERIFSCVRKNKTDQRSSLADILDALMVLKSRPKKQHEYSTEELNMFKSAYAASLKQWILYQNGARKLLLICIIMMLNVIPESPTKYPMWVFFVDKVLSYQHWVACTDLVWDPLWHVWLDDICHNPHGGQIK